MDKIRLSPGSITLLAPSNTRFTLHFFSVRLSPTLTRSQGLSVPHVLTIFISLSVSFSYNLSISHIHTLSEHLSHKHSLYLSHTHTQSMTYPLAISLILYISLTMSLPLFLSHSQYIFLFQPPPQASCATYVLEFLQTSTFHLSFLTLRYSLIKYHGRWSCITRYVESMRDLRKYKRKKLL